MRISKSAMIDFSEIDVLILCGGLGTRLRSVIGETQKTMAKVAGEPFLNLVLEYLKNSGFQRAILCTGYQAAQVEEYYRDRDVGLSLQFSREDTPLGTGGAIKNARGRLHNDTFVVLNGDSFCALDYQKFVQFHRQRKAVVTIAVSKVKDAKDYGTIVLDDEDRITAFEEKVRGGESYANAGVYCFQRSAFSLMPPDLVFSLEKDFFPSLPTLIKNDFYGFVVQEDFLDIGTSVRLQNAQKQF